MKLALVGAGGYGRNYVNWLFHNEDPACELVGIIDKYLDNSPYAEEIRMRKIPVYETLEAFYAENRADLVLIATPTFLHPEQCIYAVRHGSNVLCEKPAAPTLEGVQQMVRAEQETGKFIAIGYQWSFSPVIQKLKKDILSGLFGAPLAFQTRVLWPRKRDYYTRGSGWGGRIAKDGILVLDSIAANACAHYVHNMLFLLGDAMETSTSVVSAEAECLRANAIENFDTCVLRLHTETGIPLYFAASHAVKSTHNPVFKLEFERAAVTYDADHGANIAAVFADGRRIDYGDPMADNLKKIWDCIACIESGDRPICTSSTAAEHVRLIDALYRNVEIRDFPQELISVVDNLVYVEDLDKTLLEAYETRTMLSEMGFAGAVKTEFTV